MKVIPAGTEVLWETPSPLGACYQNESHQARVIDPKACGADVEIAAHHYGPHFTCVTRGIKLRPRRDEVEFILTNKLVYI